MDLKTETVIRTISDTKMTETTTDQCLLDQQMFQMFVRIFTFGKVWQIRSVLAEILLEFQRHILFKACTFNGKSEIRQFSSSWSIIFYRSWGGLWLLNLLSFIWKMPSTSNHLSLAELSFRSLDLLMPISSHFLNIHWKPSLEALLWWRVWRKKKKIEEPCALAELWENLWPSQGY